MIKHLKVRCKKGRIKSTLREKPDHFIFPVGGNDLNSEREPESISKFVVDLACTLKSNFVHVNISNVIIRSN